MTDQNNTLELQMKQLTIAKKYALQHAEDIRKKYGDDYVAIHPTGRVLGHNQDDFKLDEQVSIEFPGQAILITRYQDIINPREDGMDSPEMEEE
ncbi:hypothetical protein HY450_03460 [Candidatus Pacearchaeota archaeon]|nr:hypothetical protein [Candidatus Pacearchaeota archaeon]